MKRHRRSLALPSALVLILTAFTLFGSGLGTATSARAQATPAVQPATGPAPLGEWKMDSVSGTTAPDASGHGNDGTLQGGVSLIDSGIVGGHSLRFAGNGDSSNPALKSSLTAHNGFVEMTKPIIDTSRSFTVAVWVKINFTAPGGYQTFVSVDGNQVSGFYLQIRGMTNTLAFALLPADDTASNTPIVASSSFAPEADQWYHLAGVYDGAAQTISFYVDGVLQETTPFTTPWRASGHAVIGRGKFRGQNADFANADMDDVRLYDSALTATDIAALVHSGQLAAALTVDAAQPAGKVSPTFYGLMTEEISHAFDGGLYGELIQNRAFRDDANNPAHWSALDGAGHGSIALTNSDPLNASLPTSLSVTVGSSTVAQPFGIANDGYWGIPVRPDTKYRASFYARAPAGYNGSLTVRLANAGSGNIFARADVGKISKDWKRYEVVLHTDKTVAPTLDARFVIAASDPGTFDLSLVSLFPPTFNDRPNGNRIDLMTKMAAMKPSFLRMPGGNYLEGDTIPERFDWKRTIGPIENRPGHQGPWGYRSTDGMGLLEFLEWCEDLHMEPLLAVYAGYSLKGEHVAPGPGLQPYIQDALDEIEYLTGDKTTTWGARRIKDGHPVPFALHYVEIGNEDWFDKSGSYDGRFAQFYDAIKGQYPNLLLIATTPVKARVPDLLDDHYYKSAADMTRMNTKYDNYSRTGPKVLVGEWASQTSKEPWSPAQIAANATPNWEAALGDAAFLTGLERNSDIVVMESYAPLLVNLNPGARQWAQNLIGYNALGSFGSPSFYVQSVFAANTGDSILRGRLSGALGVTESVTQDSATGRIFVKIVNTGNTPTTLKIDVRDAKSVKPDQDATAIILSAPGLDVTNSINDPTHIVPVTTVVPHAGPSFSYTFPAYSATVLVMGGIKK